jgi:hypothetical protein
MKQGKSVFHPDIDKCYWIIDHVYIKRIFSDHSHSYTEHQFLIDNYADGWQLYTPKFANVKVGDWVEHVKRGQLQVVRLDTHAFKCSNGNSYKYTNGRCVAENDYVIRIVPPSEVEVEITLKGKIQKGCFPNLAFHIVNGLNGAHIPFNMLSPDQAEQVRAILNGRIL